MNVVGYVRLSRDEDKENNSSIESQKAIINDYAKSKNWTVSKMYIDDNYSGYTFTRPNFTEMMDQVTLGNINVILTKDVSRIGRNNGRVLTIIEDLRFQNIEMILINESSGGLSILNDDLAILGIKTWYNEQYVKDISRKIRASFSVKQKSGQLIMGNLYGYKKIKTNGIYQLVVDEEVRPIIELIFKLYIEGLGYKKICDVLDEKGYPTPSEYLKQIHEDKGKSFKGNVAKLWVAPMIKGIIGNDLYIGTHRTKKRKSRDLKYKQENVPKDEQYDFPNHHEAIISKEDFQLAQEVHERRVKNNYRNNKIKYHYIFRSFVECGICGSPAVGLNTRKLPIVEQGYQCRIAQKHTKKHCVGGIVKEKKILVAFKEFLKDVKATYRGYLENIEFKEKKNIINNSLQDLERQLIKAKNEMKNILSQKIIDLSKESNYEYRQIIEESYVDIENGKKKKITYLSKRIKELRSVNVTDIEENIKSNIEIFDNIIDSDIPDRKDLELILDKIIICEDRSLVFKLKVNIDKIAYFR